MLAMRKDVMEGRNHVRYYYMLKLGNQLLTQWKKCLYFSKQTSMKWENHDKIYSQSNEFLRVEEITVIG